MKNGEIFRLAQGIAKVGHLKGIKFAYGISKNKKIVDSEIESVKESVAQSETFTEFEAKRIELCKEYAEKDEKGEFKVESNEYVLPAEKKEEFEIRLNALREQNKEAIDEREKQLIDYKEFIDQESTIEFYKIKLSSVPEDISAEELEGISELITED